MADKSGNKNILIGALIVVALVLGGVLYKQSQEKSGVTVEISEDGMSIKEN